MIKNLIKKIRSWFRFDSSLSMINPYEREFSASHNYSYASAASVPRIVVRNVTTVSCESTHSNNEIHVTRKGKPNICPNCRTPDKVEEYGDKWKCSFCGHIF